VRNAVAGAAEEQLGISYRDGGWTVIVAAACSGIRSHQHHPQGPEAFLADRQCCSIK
jgi:hypothetical protein